MGSGVLSLPREARVTGPAGSAHTGALERDTPTSDTEGRRLRYLPAAPSASPLAVALGSKCDLFSTQPFLRRVARITG